LAAKELTRTQWAKLLNKEWRDLRENTVAGFIELGRDLIIAKKQLTEHGQWIPMLNEDLNFNRNTANSFMRIASSKMVGIAHHLLPPDYSTIDKLTRLDDETFKRLVEEGIICPTLRRSDIAKILREETTADDEQRVLRLVSHQGKFRTLVIDPAWEYEQLSLAGRAKPDYAMQTLDQLRMLDIKQWAEPECHLYCWTTNNFMYEASKLVDSWGFQHRTILTWIKPPPFGLGSYFRNSTEHVIFATLGETTTRPAAASIPTHFEAPRGEHSEKPEKFYEIVRAASYPPYGEANQRQARADFINLFQEIAEAAE
jgi:N6-adenosine-specific RNA methylase IME4